jgi:predicted transcriptional regulator
VPARRVTENSADRLTITLDAADRAELEVLSTKSDRSLAWIVRDAIRQYLAQAKADPDGKRAG